MMMLGKIGFKLLPMQAPNKFMGTNMAIKSQSISVFSGFIGDFLGMLIAYHTNEDTNP